MQSCLTKFFKVEPVKGPEGADPGKAQPQVRVILEPDSDAEEKERQQALERARAEARAMERAIKAERARKKKETLARRQAVRRAAAETLAAQKLQGLLILPGLYLGTRYAAENLEWIIEAQNDGVIPAVASEVSPAEGQADPPRLRPLSHVLNVTDSIKNFFDMAPRSATAEADPTLGDTEGDETDEKSAAESSPPPAQPNAAATTADSDSMLVDGGDQTLADELQQIDIEAADEGKTKDLGGDEADEDADYDRDIDDLDHDLDLDEEEDDDLMDQDDTPDEKKGVEPSAEGRAWDPAAQVSPPDESAVEGGNGGEGSGGAEARKAKTQRSRRNLSIKALLQLLKPLIYLRIPVQDSPSENLGQYFESAVRFIAGAISAGGSVLVHCREGRSRSVTIVIAYLIMEKKWTLKQAYDHLSAMTDQNVNEGFRRQLMDLELRVHQTHSIDFFNKADRVQRMDYNETRLYRACVEGRESDSEDESFDESSATTTSAAAIKPPTLSPPSIQTKSADMPMSVEASAATTPAEPSPVPPCRSHSPLASTQPTAESQPPSTAKSPIEIIDSPEPPKATGEGPAPPDSVPPRPAPIQGPKVPKPPKKAESTSPKKPRGKASVAPKGTQSITSFFKVSGPAATIDKYFHPSGAQ